MKCRGQWINTLSMWFCEFWIRRHISFTTDIDWKGTISLTQFYFPWNWTTELIEKWSENSPALKVPALIEAWRMHAGGIAQMVQRRTERQGAVQTQVRILCVAMDLFFSKSQLLVQTLLRCSSQYSPRVHLYALVICIYANVKIAKLVAAVPFTVWTHENTDCTHSVVGLLLRLPSSYAFWSHSAF